MSKEIVKYLFFPIFLVSIIFLIAGCGESSGGAPLYTLITGAQIIEQVATPTYEVTYTGFVKSEGTKSPLSSASVILYSSASVILKRTSTTDEGKFFLSNLASDIFDLKISAGSYYSEKYFKIQIYKDGTKSPPDSSDFYLATATILFSYRGSVTDVSSGKGISNVSVTMANASSSFSTFTTSEGKYVFDGIQAGIYDLKIVGGEQYGDFQTKVAIYSDGTKSPPDDSVFNIGTAGLYGYVKDKKSGSALSKVEVSLMTIDGMIVQSVVTGVDGKFELKSIPVGNFTLRINGQKEVSGKDYNALISTLNVFSYQSKSLSDGVEFLLERQTRFSGNVIDENGNPIKDVLVMVRTSSGTTEIYAQSVTDDAGSFVLSGLPAGTFEMYFDGTNSVLDYGKNIIPFVILEDGSTSISSGKFFKLDKFIDLSGKITNELGTYLAGVTCEIEGYGSVLSNSNGTFLFRNVIKGTYKITFQKTGYRSLQIDIQVDPNSNTPFTPPDLLFQLIPE
ncbi:MAG: carboxypeptidase regulatory-like domain-containing protein [Candidatus Riflebacteria bacterium]|nr:carboxypeptidase regulatory-like domain-containing protein [Candidatus Riflebacteria bacterium]